MCETMNNFDEYYEAVFKSKFLEAKGNVFQDFFSSLMSKAYPEDFIPCRPWGNVGDRKNDGYLKSERTLFQVYAPNEMSMAAAVRKIRDDFQGALPFWEDHFDKWVFVHNSIDGLSADIIKELLKLGDKHSEIKVTHWGFDDLQERARLLSDANVRTLLGPKPKNEDAKKQAHEMIKAGQELIRSGKQKEALEQLRRALTFARVHEVKDQEVGALVALALVSPRRRGSDRDTYFREAKKRFDQLKSDEARVIYYRLEASIMEEQREFDAAEAAYAKALECNKTDKDGESKLEMQHCLVRASLVHFLCGEKREEEAKAVLELCDEFAIENPDEEDGEVFGAAMGAGIHLAIETGDENEAVRRISELEHSTTSPHIKERRSEDLVDIANRCSQRKAHSAVEAAATAAVRLGRDHGSAQFLMGAIYTEAAVALRAGDYDAALGKAEALIGICNGPDDLPIRQATHHLISEISRVSGDTQKAVELAKKATEMSQGDIESAAYFKLAFARCLNDNGETEAALREAKQAWGLLDHQGLQPKIAMEFLGPISNFASQLGIESDIKAAVDSIERLPDESDDFRSDKERLLQRAESNTMLRERFLEVFYEDDTKAETDIGSAQSLEEANAQVTKPLIEYWSKLKRAGLYDKECISGAYDFWARGNFGRILLNSRYFYRSFNIMIEVRSLADIQRAIRLWGLYAEMLILLWKGPTEGGYAIVPFPDDYSDPGGWGYTIAMGSKFEPENSEQEWFPAMGMISTFPEEVIHFLATEAAPFIEIGRLIVVPSTGVGCINPGHGPFEQLLAEAANAIPSLRSQKMSGSLIGEVPYSPDVPLPVLAELVQTEADSLRKLRLLLLRRSQQIGTPVEQDAASRMLSLELDDALRDIAARSEKVLRRKGYAESKEKVLGQTAEFMSDGSPLSGDATASPYAPLMMLESLGYGWRVEGTEIPKFPERFEPKKGELLGAWLAPPSAGWAIPMIQKQD